MFLDLRAGSGQRQGRLWQTASPLPGDRSMRACGEHPREGNASTLSEILMPGVPEKYYLSPKACQGILRRASARGRELPAILKKALERQAARYTGPLETAPTVSATYGMGGNNQPFVAEPDTPETGQTEPGRRCVQAFGICSKESNAMKSDNPRSGFYEAGVSRTLDCSCCSPSANQGGIAVVEPEGMQSSALHGSMTGRKDKNGTQGSGVNEGVSFSTAATDRHAAACPTYCTSKNSHFTRAGKELADTLVATDYKDPPVINDAGREPGYIVRRLTATECARLQGLCSVKSYGEYKKKPL